jgi:hypothetical protein
LASAVSTYPIIVQPVASALLIAEA